MTQALKEAEQRLREIARDGFKQDGEECEFLNSVADALSEQAEPVAQHFEEWYAKGDARFWNNYDACLSAWTAAPKSNQPLATRELSDEEIISHLSKSWEHQWFDGDGKIKVRFDYHSLLLSVRALMGAKQ